MFIYAKQLNKKAYCATIMRLIVCALSFSLILGPTAGYAQSIPLLNLPVHGAMVSPSPAYMPVLLKGMTIHPEDPLRFDFIIDAGDSGLGVGDADMRSLQEESEKLVKYFLASMTVPEDDLWVNLSPYESERIVPDELGKTELGRDMLAQDYILKQLTASLMYPEEELGKKFWDKVYKQAEEQFGTSEIPVNTYNKVWILPQTATVYEHEQTVYVVDAHLKVMLDTDYKARKIDTGSLILDASIQHPESSIDNQDTVSNEIIREIIIPAIEKEVNEGEHFAPLRQIYHSLILAKWYKETFKNSLLSQIYVDKNMIDGVDIEDTTIKDQIYAQYMAAYKKGVFNYIKEDYDRLSNEIIPRKYFSGGITGDIEIAKSSSPVVKPNGPQFMAKVVVRSETGGVEGSEDLMPRATLPVEAKKDKIERKALYSRDAESSYDRNLTWRYEANFPFEEKESRGFVENYRIYLNPAPENISDALELVRQALQRPDSPDAKFKFVLYDDDASRDDDFLPWNQNSQNTKVVIYIDNADDVLKMLEILSQQDGIQKIIPAGVLSNTIPIDPLIQVSGVMREHFAVQLPLTIDQLNNLQGSPMFKPGTALWVKHWGFEDNVQLLRVLRKKGIEFLQGENEFGYVIDFERMLEQADREEGTSSPVAFPFTEAAHIRFLDAGNALLVKKDGINGLKKIGLKKPLGKKRNKYIGHIAHMFKDADGGVRELARETLEELEATDEQFIEGYIAALTSPHESARARAVVELIGRISGLRRNYSDLSDPMTEFFDSKSEEIVEILLGMLSDRSQSVQRAVEDGFGFLGIEDEQKIDTYIALLFTDNAVAVNNAARKLGAMEDMRAFDPLIKSLTGESKSKDKETRIGALVKIAKANNIGDKRITEPLIELLGGKDYIAAETGLNKFRRNKKKIIAGYIRAARSFHKEARLNAYEKLHEYEQDKETDLDVAALVTEELASDWFYYRDTDRLMGELGFTRDQKRKWYIRALNNTHLDASLQAINELVELKAKRAITPLMELLKVESMEIRHEVKGALNELGVTDEQLIKGYKAALSSDNKAARIGARLELNELGVNKYANNINAQSRPPIDSVSSPVRKDVLREDFRFYDTKFKQYLADIRGEVPGSKESLNKLLQAVSYVIETEMTDFPVEAKWPVLKAVALLNKDDRQLLIEILEEYESGERSTLGNAILLMYNIVPERWLGVNAREMMGRVIYTVSAENTLIAGGLGYVQQVHEEYLRALGARVVSIEPKYEFRSDIRGNPQPYDYRQELNIKDVNVVHEDEIEVDGLRTKIKYWLGELENGKEAVFIQESVEKGDNRRYTNVVYDYNKFGNQSWEEFNAFFGKSVLKIVQHLERKRRKEEGDAWKPAVVWGNDSQASGAMALIVDAKDKARRDENSVFKDIYPVFTTHTFGNRQNFDISQINRILGDLLGLRAKWFPASVRHNTMDMASLAIRLVDGAGGLVNTVSRKQKFVLDRNGFDPYVRTRAITNGDELERAWNEVKGIYQDLYKRELKDVDDLGRQQARGVIKEAVRRLNVSFKYEGVDDLGLDPDKPIVSYAGRLVSVKISPNRTFTETNIRRLIEDGFNVVLFGRLQNYLESKELAEKYYRIERKINEQKAKDPGGTAQWGKLVFKGQFNDQQKQLLLIASALVALDSDNETGTAEWTEVNGAIALSWILASPWKLKVSEHKVIEGEGIIGEANQRGVNLVIPNVDVGFGGRGPKAVEEAYYLSMRDKLQSAVDHPEEFYEGVIQSAKLAQIINGHNTSAAYLTEWSRNLHNIERWFSESREISKKFAEGLTEEQKQQLLNQAMDDVDSFEFIAPGTVGINSGDGLRMRAEGGLKEFLRTLQVVEDNIWDGNIIHMKDGHFLLYMTDLVLGIEGGRELLAWLRGLQKDEDLSWYKKDLIFRNFVEQLVNDLENPQPRIPESTLASSPVMGYGAGGKNYGGLSLDEARQADLEERERYVTPIFSDHFLLDSLTGRIRFNEENVDPLVDLQGIELWGVRHGRTGANVLSREQKGMLAGIADEEINQLDKIGARQAVRAAETLVLYKLRDKIRSGEKIVIVTAKLGRTIDSSEPLVDFIRGLGDSDSVEIVEDTRLNEMNYGSAANKDEKDYTSQEREQFQQIREKKDATAAFPGGEAFLDVTTSSLSLLQDMKQRYPERTIVFISSRIRLAAIRAVLGDKTLLDETGQIDWLYKDTTMKNGEVRLLHRAVEPTNNADDGAIIPSSSPVEDPSRRQFIGNVGITVAGVLLFGSIVSRLFDDVPTAAARYADDVRRERKQVLPGSKEWDDIQSFIEQALNDSSVRSNSKFRQSVEAFQSAANNTLYVVDNSAAAFVEAETTEDGKYFRSVVGINYTFLQELLKRSQEQEIYKFLAIGLLIKEGSTVIGYENDPDYHVQFGQLGAGNTSLTDEQLKEYVARGIEGEAVGYRALIEYFLAAYDINDLLQLFVQLDLKENDPGIKGMFHHYMVILLSIEAAKENEFMGLSGKEEDLFLKAAIYSQTFSGMLNPALRDQFEKIFTTKEHGNIPLGIEEGKFLLDDPAMLMEMQFLVDPRYVGRSSSSPVNISKIKKFIQDFPNETNLLNTILAYDHLKSMALESRLTMRSIRRGVTILRFSDASIARFVGNLVDEGWLRAIEDPDDARAYFYELTENGSDYLEALEPEIKKPMGMTKIITKPLSSSPVVVQGKANRRPLSVARDPSPSHESLGASNVAKGDSASSPVSDEKVESYMSDEAAERILRHLKEKGYMIAEEITLGQIKKVFYWLKEVYAAYNSGNESFEDWWPDFLIDMNYRDNIPDEDRIRLYRIFYSEDEILNGLSEADIDFLIRITMIVSQSFGSEFNDLVKTESEASSPVRKVDYEKLLKQLTTLVEMRSYPETTRGDMREGGIRGRDDFRSRSYDRRSETETGVDKFDIEMASKVEGLGLIGLKRLKELNDEKNGPAEDPANRSTYRDINEFLDKQIADVEQVSSPVEKADIDQVFKILKRLAALRELAPEGSVKRLGIDAEISEIIADLDLDDLKRLREINEDRQGDRAYEFLKGFLDEKIKELEKRASLLAKGTFRSKMSAEEVRALIMDAVWTKFKDEDLILRDIITDSHIEQVWNMDHDFDVEFEFEGDHRKLKIIEIEKNGLSGEDERSNFLIPLNKIAFPWVYADGLIINGDQVPVVPYDDPYPEAARAVFNRIMATIKFMSDYEPELAILIPLLGKGNEEINEQWWNENEIGQFMRDEFMRDLWIKLGFEMVLQEFLLNTLRHAENKRGMVEIRAGIGYERDYILGVQDFGRGLAVLGNDRKKIFDKNFTTSPREPGLQKGLGLHLVRSYVTEVLGGDIHPYDNINDLKFPREKKGATFKVVIPFKDRSSSPINSINDQRTTSDDLGGIDMNNINVNRQGGGVDIHFDPIQLQEMINMGVTGFTPVIINITPLPSVLPLLGLAPREEEEEFKISQLN